MEKESEREVDERHAGLAEEGRAYIKHDDHTGLVSSMTPAGEPGHAPLSPGPRRRSRNRSNKSSVQGS